MKTRIIIVCVLAMLATACTPYGWGSNDVGQLGSGSLITNTVLEPTATLDEWGSTISAGQFHSCALQSNGTAWCWGDNGGSLYGPGKLGDGSQVGNSSPVQIAGGGVYLDISAGEDHSCGIRDDGSAWCWGTGSLGDGNGSATSYSPVAVAGGATYTAIAAGDNHSCALDTDGTIWCWGSNGSGQLGDGTTTSRLNPTPVSGAGTYISVKAGDGHTCGIQTDGTAWCWGRNHQGQLGNGTLANRNVPTAVAGGGTYTSLDPSDVSVVAYTCGVRTNGTAWCWGNGGYGQLGNGAAGIAFSPVQVAGGGSYTTISAGFGQTCALRTDNTAWCWGWNTFSQLGDGTTTNSTTPRAVAGGDTYRAIESGNYYSCAIRTDGSTRCWGRGRGATPTEVGPGPEQNFVATSAGFDSSCWLTDTTQVWCAGRNDDGQIGDVSTVDRATKTFVDNGYNSIDNGAFHACGVYSPSGTRCWGNNEHGQLGDGTTTNRSRPTFAGRSMRQVSAGGAGNGLSHTCGITPFNTLFCWGDNTYGQVGDATTGTDRLSPTQVAIGGTRWDTVSAGGLHSCAIKEQGTLWCWGRNNVGQLGTGDLTNRTQPTRIGTATNWKTVSAGGFHTCATKTNGTLWCFGDNNFDQIGNGTTTTQTTPTQIGTATNWVEVSAGGFHTCARRYTPGTLATLWCWGRNHQNQIGDGTTTNQPTPTQIGAGQSWTSVATGFNHTIAIATD